MKPLSERMHMKFHDEWCTTKLDDAPNRDCMFGIVEKWAAEVEDLEDTRDGYKAVSEWRQERIEALEKLKGLAIPKGEWSICADHKRAYWTDEGCFPCRIEALENYICNCGKPDGNHSGWCRIEDALRDADLAKEKTASLGFARSQSCVFGDYPSRQDPTRTSEGHLTAMRRRTNGRP